MHSILGHAGEGITHKTAKYIGYKLTGKMAKSESCSIGKMKQKAINKTTSTDNSMFKIDEKLYMDISSVKGKSARGSKFWAMWIDERWIGTTNPYLHYGLRSFLYNRMTFHFSFSIFHFFYSFWILNDI